MPLLYITNATRNLNKWNQRLLNIKNIITSTELAFFLRRILEKVRKVKSDCIWHTFAFLHVALGEDPTSVCLLHKQSQEHV